MIINATDLKNNLGKYLRMAEKEEVIITSNGRKVARLQAYEDVTYNTRPDEIVKEASEAYACTPRKVTYEEFLQITENSEERYEYIDGEIYLLSSPIFIHQKILKKLISAFLKWFDGKKCQPYFAPFDITLLRDDKNKNIVQPDLLVICDEEENLNEKGYYMGIPSLVGEILSESSRRKDMIKKMDLYMSTGVREYWIVDPFNREVHVYLNTDMLEIAHYKNNETAKSFIFEGLEVNLSSIFS